jgi:S1-C subfamily serine protease
MAGGAAAAALVLAGCTAQGGAEASGPSGAAPTAESPAQANVPQISREQLIRDPRLLAQLSPELPSKVRAAADALVGIQVTVTPPTDYINASGEIQATQGGTAFRGSGSVVAAGGRQVILTAGHVQKPTENHCGDEEIHYQDPDGLILGATKRQYLEYNPGSYPGIGPDIGIIVPGTGKERGNDGQQQAAIPLRSSVAPQLGDEVFVAGYPDARTGEQQRDPANYAPLDTPSVHSAMVLGTTREGYVTLLEGAGNTYAPGDKYNTTTAGNSGGAIIDMEGYQIAVVSGGASERSNTAYVAKQYGVELPDPAHYQIAHAQLVTQGEADSLVAQAGRAPDCTSLPHSQQRVS